MSARGGVAEVFWAFLRLGVTSFGGPTAHLGYFREEFVARRRWVSDGQYGELVALSQFLPGPGSSQVGFALGLGRAGWWGGLAAWLAFTLPSAVLMVLFAFGAGLFESSFGSGVIAGLKAAAVAVVAHAVFSMARVLTSDVRRGVIAVGALILVLALPVPYVQLGVVGLGALCGLMWCRTAGTPIAPDTDPVPEVRVSARAGAVCLGVLAVLLVALPAIAAVTGGTLLRFADAFARAGALVFGGGHVVLPMLHAETAISSTVSPEQFLAGYGAAQALPGPLFSFAAYLGAVAEPGGGIGAALVALVAVFLPGLLLMAGVLPFWLKFRSVPSVGAGMRGANAAVVGVLAAALVNPIALSGVTDLSSLAIAIGAFGLVAWKRVPVWVPVLLAAGAGGVLGLLGA